jgi:hypothetical protein
MATNGLNFIHVSHGINVIRVVKMGDGNYFSFNTTISEIQPFMTRSIAECVDNVLNWIHDDDVLIHMVFGYKRGSLGISKKKRLKKLLLTPEIDCNHRSLLSWMLML